MAKVAKGNGKDCQRKWKGLPKEKGQKKGSIAPFFLQNLLTKN
jgi:hypothetical protein